MDRFLGAYNPADPLPSLASFARPCGVPPKMWAAHMVGRWKVHGNLWRACKKARDEWQAAKVIELYLCEPPIPYQAIAKQAGMAFARVRAICARFEEEFPPADR